MLARVWLAGISDIRVHQPTRAEVAALCGMHEFSLANEKMIPWLREAMARVGRRMSIFEKRADHTRASDNPSAIHTIIPLLRKAMARVGRRMSIFEKRADHTRASEICSSIFSGHCVASGS